MERTQLISNYLLYVLTAIIIFVCGCREELPVMAVNKYDPESPYYIGNPVSKVVMEPVNDHSVRIQWRDSSSYETGFRIERSNDVDGKVAVFTTGANQNYLLDSTLEYYKAYTYRVATVTNTSFYTYTDSLTVVFDPYQGRHQMFDSWYILAAGGNRIARLVDYGITAYNVVDSLVYCGRSDWGGENMSLSYDGRYVSFCGSDRIGYYDIDHGTSILLRVTSLDYGAYETCFSRDNQYLFDVSWGAVEIWNLKDKSCRVCLYDNIPIRYNINITPDNKYLTGASNDTLFVCDFNDYKTYATLRTNKPYSFSVDGKILVYYDHIRSSICFWNEGTNSVVSEIPTLSGLNSFRLFGNDRYLVLNSIESGKATIKLIELRNYQVVTSRIVKRFPGNYKCFFTTAGDYILQYTNDVDFNQTYFCKYSGAWRAATAGDVSKIK
jgi:hypothetical protein